MFSFPLYERLRQKLLSSKRLPAFQAGRWRLGVRRQGIESVARSLRSEYVTGTYFSTLGVRAFGGRVFTPDDDKPRRSASRRAQPPFWQTAYASDTSVVGSTLSSRAIR